MKRYRVWLDPEYRWATAQVNAREFTKTPVVLQEVELTEEIANSPLLVVEEIDADLRTEDGSEEGDADFRTEDGLSEGVEATEAARALAAEMGLPLGAVVGSGAGGRVTKKDVERAVGDGRGSQDITDGSEEEDG